MAKQTYNNPINKHVNWGGDDNTGGLPVSGAMVQKFIKDSLNEKAGCFYYDTTNNRYLVFADDDMKNEYLLDPTKTSLIIGTFEAPFNYSAEIFLTSDSYKAIPLGSTGNYIDFTFDIKNKQGSSTGENVTVTYTIIRNATKQVITETKKHGDSVHFNIDNYLGEGTNTIIVGVSGQSTLAATTAAITYQVVNLKIEDIFDISEVYNVTSGQHTLEIPFTVSGYGTKTVVWRIDGEELEFVKGDDEIVDVTATRTKYIDLSNLSHGRHSLQIQAYTVINGENFYTDILYRDFFINTGADVNTMIGVAITIPSGKDPVAAGEFPIIYNMVQYIPYNIRFAIYSPTNAANLQTQIVLDDNVLGSVNTVNGEVYDFVIIPTTSGDKSLKLVLPDITYEMQTPTAPTMTTLEEITNGLVMDFNGTGKTNSSIDKDYWTQGDFYATFNGFEWNNKSGWNNGRLEMNAGTSFGINYAPLANKPTDTGKTIELEWSTKNVINDDAVICDLRGDNGAGILITATKVSLTSVNGVTIETEYKSDENVRIAFVINKASNTTNQHLSFIYCNGVISRGETWAISDSYTSNKELLFTATNEVEISLRSIRVYDAELSSDQILNNYTLYRDNVAEMLEIYDRNDVYESGTTTFSPDKMMGRLPVMIVTGDIPVLEETSDKNTQIVVDIDYYNMQDPTKNFKMVGAAMRPQGTSSMGYPKKNFRIYTRELEGTILYDYQNKVVKDKLYSFKKGAQPVDCWCLKADYAESSGAHNTGIARLWNKALYDARVTVDLGEGNPHNVDRAAVLRTTAQTKALEANYPYDVRTTIDGFPILMFYRRNENDSPIFIGKYNFNNDKSTESVFGFTGIPNFDNSRMQCWEILNNGNSLALFTEADSFDTGWKDAFESRYPDTKTPNTSDLKAFCQWMSTVTPEAFVTEKWNHIDVYKVAAYWVYLMRHAGADQFVKNAMLTSEDGEKFYYILYDNDTINGLINTGDIRIKPTDGRQTVDASGSYVFAGHDSRMWNLLEADEEFNEIVAAVDNALYSAGISYINTIKVFDEDQSNKWVERVYNQDAEYKYIGPYREEGTNNLFMMQGSRDLHRRWWLSKRFSIFDAKYVSGTYKSDAVEIKCLNGTEAGQQFTITAGYPLDYGYGINNKPREKGVTLNIGDSYTFTTQEVVNVGDPIRIYGAPNISELDLSLMTSRLATLTVTNANSDTLGTKMKKLVVGNPSVANMELKEISGLKKLTSLEHLDIQGLKNITSLDLTSQPQLKELKAFGSNIASVSFAKGAPVEKLELPTSVTSLDLNQLTRLTTGNLLFESGMNGISSISIKGCPKLSKDFAWVYNWYANKTTPNETSSLVMDSVDWKDVNAEQLAELTNLGNIQLKGKVVVTDITLGQLNMLIEVFGESAFDKNAELYINAPDAIFVTGRTELLEGESEDYACIVFGAEVQGFTWTIYSGGSSSYTTIDATTGLLTTKEGSGNRTLTIRVVAKTSAGTKTLDTPVSVKARTYPASGTTTLSGSLKLNNTREVYKLEVATPNVNGEYIVDWSLTGMDGYAEIESSSNTQCVIKKLQETATVVKGTLIAAAKKKYNNGSLFSKTLAIELVNDTIAETDIGVVTTFYNAGLCANSTYITKEEAALITEIDLQPGTSYSTSIFYSQRSKIKTFDGFQYFTSIVNLPVWVFYECTAMKSIKLPPSLISIGSHAFSECYCDIVIPEGVVELKSEALCSYYSGRLKYVYIPSTLVTLPEKWLGGQGAGSARNQIEIEVSPDNPIYKSVDGILYTKDNVLVRHAKCNLIQDIVIPEWVVGVGTYAFNDEVVNSLTINSDLNLASNAFKFDKINTITINGNVTGSASAFYFDKSPSKVNVGPKVGDSSWSCLKSMKKTRSSKRIFYFDEGGYFIESGGFVFNNDKTTLYCLDDGTLGTYTIPSSVTKIHNSLFYERQKTYDSNFKIDVAIVEEGVTKIPYECFAYCDLKEIYLPASVTSIGSRCFYLSNSNLSIYYKSLNPPSISGSIYANSTADTKIICPYQAQNVYKNRGWANFGVLSPDAEILRCSELSITAEDVPGNYTSTFINVSAKVGGHDNLIDADFDDVDYSDRVISDVFGYNNTEEPVNRILSYTFLNRTASVDIVQLPFGEGSHSFSRGILGYTWTSTTSGNPDTTIYDKYNAYSNMYTHSDMDIELGGYSTFKMFFRKQSSTDKVWVSELNNLENFTELDVNVSSDTSIDNYTLFELNNLNGESYKIRIKGYYSYSSQVCVLIPKDQEE